MSALVYPHTGLILGQRHSILISGPHIHVVETQTGEILHSTLTTGEKERESALKSGPIRCYAGNGDRSVFVTSSDDKKLKVWKTDGLRLLSERELPKKPTQIQLTKDEQTIVVSDKFGDVFSYPLYPDPSIIPDPDQGKRGALTSHENPSNGTLILGHTSLLTSFLLTEDEKYIITADRDEHIRVSWYPQGYVIERYCLGHKKFVSAIHVPKFASSSLISGGGDPELKIWDWLSGKLIHDIPILEIVEPFIKVKAPKSRGADETGEGTSSQGGQQGRGRRRRRRGKGKEQEGEEGGDGGGEEAKEQDAESADVVMDEGDTAETPTGVSATPTPAEPERPTLVVRRIDSVDRESSGRRVIFGVVGCTALFQFAFPSEGELTPPTIQALDLGKPVIDFIVADDGLVWVLVDNQWSPNDTSDDSQGGDSNPVRLIGWSDDGNLLELPDSPALLSTLNTKCLLPASEADLKTLDLYSPLSSMPKTVDPEHDPMVTEDLTELVMSLDEKVSAPVVKTKGKKQARGKGPDGGPTQRELARLKNKKALLAKIQEQQGQSATPEPGEGDEEREAKKVKADELAQGGT